MSTHIQSLSVTTSDPTSYSRVYSMLSQAMDKLVEPEGTGLVSYSSVSASDETLFNGYAMFEVMDIITEATSRVGVQPADARLIIEALASRGFYIEAR